MRPFLLYFLIVFSTNLYGQNWKDQKVERLFLENNFSESKKYIESQLTSSTSKEQTIYYYTKLSHVYLRTGEFDKALELAKKSVAEAETITDNLLQSETWRAMTFACIRTSKLDSAMVYSQKMYRYGKENSNYDFTRAALMSMGNISMQQDKLSDALQFYTDASIISKKNKNTANLKVDYYNIGLALSRQKKPELSNNYLEQAVNIASKEKDDVLLVRIYGSLLDNYSILKNNEKRLFYQEKANTIAKKNNNLQLLAMGYSNMMEWSLNTSNPIKAIEYGQNSMQYLKKFPMQQLEARVDSLMYIALKAVKKNDVALQFLESFTKKKGEMVSSETHKNLNELIVKYDVENKNLKIKNQENQLLIANRERNIYLLVMVVLILLITSIMVLKYNRKIYKKILFNKDKYYDNLFHQTRTLLLNSYSYNQNTNTKSEEAIVDLKDSKSEFLFNKLIDIIEQEQLFLKPDLDQKSLIRILGTNKKYLYEAIKFHGETNFRGIINRLRVNHAKKLIAEQLDKDKTIDTSNLYTNCGFNANSTFYRIFKSYSGLSPVEYSIEFKKDYLLQKEKREKKRTLSKKSE